MRPSWPCAPRNQHCCTRAELYGVRAGYLRRKTRQHWCLEILWIISFRSIAPRNRSQNHPVHRRKSGVHKKIDVRIGFGGQSCPQRVVAAQAQTPPNLWSEDFNAPTPRRRENGTARVDDIDLVIKLLHCICTWGIFAHRRKLQYLGLRKNKSAIL